MLAERHVEAAAPLPRIGGGTHRARPAELTDALGCGPSAVSTPGWTIVGRLSIGEERLSLSRALGTAHDVTFCSTSIDLIRQIKARSPRLVVLDVAAISGHELTALATLLRDQQLRVVARLPLSVGALRHAIALQRADCEAWLSLRSIDELQHCVARVLTGAHDESARSEILSHLAHYVADARLCPLMAAVAVGETDPTVNRFARACGMPVRTFQSHVRRLGLPTPKRLLLWSVALHTAWRLERLDWSAKKAAIRSGYTSARALSNAVARLTARRASGLRRTHSFVSLLEQFTDTIVDRRERARTGTSHVV